MWRFLIALLLLSTNGISQTKQQLIDSIIKVNRVDSDCIGAVCSESEQYNNFQKLKNLMSDQELNLLSVHKNPVLRTYASIELIQSGKGDVVQLFSDELEKNEKVETFEGCLMDYESVAKILYFEYWNKIRIEARDKAQSESHEEQAMKKRVETDLIMEKLDSVVIHTDHNVFWFLYVKVFENRKHKTDYLPKIEELAFNKSNYYALDYLRKHYPNQYEIRLNKYLTTRFVKTSFIDYDEIPHLYYYIEILLKSGRKDYRKIAIDKLKGNDSWKIELAWFRNLFKEYGVEL